MNDPIKQAAREAGTYLVRKTRDNGDDYYHLSDDAPEWVRDMVYAAHDGMMPDDYRYMFVARALDRIDEADDVNDIMIDDPFSTDTSDLTAWLESNARRIAYFDDILTDYRYTDDAPYSYQVLAVAAIQEELDVLDSVLRSLKGHTPSWL